MPFHSSFLRAALCGALALTLAGTGCKTLVRKRTLYPKHPIAVRVVSKYIDEDSPMDYTVAFRNAGREIVSFDYTISDERGVPHVDKDGPNSGLIENLYPGAEVEVPNPTKRRKIWATVGVVAYGKKTKEDLQRIFAPGTAMAAPATSGEPPIF